MFPFGLSYGRGISLGWTVVLAANAVAQKATKRQESQENGAMLAQPRPTFTTEDYRVASGDISSTSVLTSISVSEALQAFLVHSSEAGQRIGMRNKLPMLQDAARRADARLAANSSALVYVSKVS
jgi:hypothetical protein